MLFEGFETIRRIFFVLFIGLVAAFIAIISLQKMDEYGRKHPAPVEMKNVRIRVYRQGPGFADGLGGVRKNIYTKWEARARRVYISPDGKKYRLKTVEDGIYYRKTKPPLFFEAAAGSYDSATEKVEMKGGLEMYSENEDFFKTERAEWDGKNQRLAIRTPVVMRMDDNVYDGNELEAWGEDLSNFRVRGGVKVAIYDLRASAVDEDKSEIDEEDPDGKYTKNLKLAAELVEYRDVDKILRCYSQEDSLGIFVPGVPPLTQSEAVVRLEGKNYVMTSRDMFVDRERKFAHAAGKVHIVRRAEKNPENDSRVARALLKRETTFDTEEAFYYWKDRHIDVPMNVVMASQDIDASAGRAFIDSKNDTVFLSYGVNVYQEKGDWLIDEDIVKKDASDKVKEAAREKTNITCDSLEVDFRNDGMKAYGNVTAVQEKRRMQGGYADYDSRNETWTLYGEPVVEDGDYTVSAKRFIYYEGQGFMEAMGGVTALAGLKEDDREEAMKYFRERDGKEPPPEKVKNEKAVLSADHMRYDENEDRNDAVGNAVLKYLDVTITADEVHTDNENRTANGKGHVVFDDPRNHATAESFSIDMEKKTVVLEGGVRMKDKGRPAEAGQEEEEPFEVEAKKVEYNWDDRKGTAEGDVVVTAESRNGSADRLDFDRKKEIYLFAGNVKLHQDNGDWFSEGKDRGYFGKDDDKARKIAEKPTDITCSTAVLDDKREKISLDGDVNIEQKGRRLRAKKVNVDTKGKVFEARGEVYMSQDSGDWLFEEKIIDEEVEKDIEEKIRRPMKVTAALLVSAYGEDRIYLEGGVNAVEGRNVVSSDKLWHYGESKRTILEGNVNVKDDRGREFKAESVIYDKKNNTVEAFRSISGSTDLKEIEEKKE